MEENGFRKVKEFADKFARQEGRQPRIMISNLGQTGNEFEVKVLASKFADIGFDVDICPPTQTTKELAKQAVENDVHFLWLSCNAGEFKDVVSRIVKELKSFERGDIGIAIGGEVEKKEYELLVKAGAIVLMEQNSKISDAAIHMLELLLEE